MQNKYDKYWGNIKKINILLYIVVVLDLQNKLEFVEFCFKRMYASEETEVITKKVKETVVELFNEYRRKMQPFQFEQVSDGSQMSQVTQYTSEINILHNKKKAMKSDFKKYRFESGCVEQKTEIGRASCRERV